MENSIVSLEEDRLHLKRDKLRLGHVVCHCCQIGHTDACTVVYCFDE